MIDSIYTSGDVLRGINERVAYYEGRHGIIVHDIHIEGGEVVIDYTLPAVSERIDLNFEVMPYDKD